MTLVELGDTARELAREVLIHGPISRAELGRRLGLSPASLTRLSKPFLDRGIFIEAPDLVQGATGRPARPLDVAVDSRRFVGVKLSGDTAHGVFTDLRASALALDSARCRATTPLWSSRPSASSSTRSRRPTCASRAWV